MRTDEQPQVLTLSTDSWLKLVGFVLLQTVVLVSIFWKFTTETETRLAILELNQATLSKIVERIELRQAPAVTVNTNTQLEKEISLQLAAILEQLKKQ
jgi:hypothetical protein